MAIQDPYIGIEQWTDEELKKRQKLDPFITPPNGGLLTDSVGMPVPDDRDIGLWKEGDEGPKQIGTDWFDKYFPFIKRLKEGSGTFDPQQFEKDFPGLDLETYEKYKGQYPFSDLPLYDEFGKPYPELDLERYRGFEKAYPELGPMYDEAGNLISRFLSGDIKAENPPQVKAASVSDMIFKLHEEIQNALGRN